jgi:hypothetical protein
LAAYRAGYADSFTLAEYLTEKVFGENAGTTVEPDPDDVRGFTEFMKNYTAGLAAERAAIGAMK